MVNFVDIDQFYKFNMLSSNNIMRPVIWKEIFNLPNIKYISFSNMNPGIISNKIINFRKLEKINLCYSDVWNLNILSSFNNLDEINLTGAKFSDKELVNLNARSIPVDLTRLQTLKKINNNCSYPKPPDFLSMAEDY